MLKIYIEKNYYPSKIFSPNFQPFIRIKLKNRNWLFKCQYMNLNSSTIRFESLIHHQYTVFGGFGWVDIILNKAVMMASPDLMLLPHPVMAGYFNFFSFFTPGRC